MRPKRLVKSIYKNQIILIQRNSTVDIPCYWLIETKLVDLSRDLLSVFTEPSKTSLLETLNSINICPKLIVSGFSFVN